MQLVTNVLGAFIIRNGKIIKQKIFPANPEKIAEKLKQTEKSYCAEEAELIKELADTGNKKVYVNNPTRFRGLGLNITILEDEERVPVYKIAADMYMERRDVDPLMRKVNRLLVRERLKEIDRDQILIQATDSLNDIDEAINRLVERLREWYSLHYPELDNLVVTHDTYSKLVLDVGDRGGYATAKLNFDQKTNEKIIKSTEDSLGVKFTEDDIKATQNLARQITQLFAAQKDTETYIEKLMAEVAPNLNALAGPVLGARLISKAHGLQRLATLPAGTIQLLGAEDAFFRFLKTGKKPPKHGIIFQLPAIRGAGRNVRGKIARSFAAKLALAARADAYHGDFCGDRLKADLDRRIASIK